jgi:hypothetical protein
MTNIGQEAFEKVVELRRQIVERGEDPAAYKLRIHRSAWYAMTAHATFRDQDGTPKLLGFDVEFVPDIELVKK